MYTAYTPVFRAFSPCSERARDIFKQLLNPAYAEQKNRSIKMWIVLFIVAVLFVLGSALILLRSAKTPKIPDNVKSQPYDKDNSDDW